VFSNARDKLNVSSASFYYTGPGGGNPVYCGVPSSRPDALKTLQM